MISLKNTIPVAEGSSLPHNLLLGASIMAPPSPPRVDVSMYSDKSITTTSTSPTPHLPNTATTLLVVCRLLLTVSIIAVLLCMTLLLVHIILTFRILLPLFSWYVDYYSPLVLLLCYYE